MIMGQTEPCKKKKLKYVDYMVDRVSKTLLDFMYDGYSYYHEALRLLYDYIPKREDDNEPNPICSLAGQRGGINTHAGKQFRPDAPNTVHPLQ